MERQPREWLREIRNAKGLSASQVAKKIYYSTRYYQMIEAGHPGTRPMLEKIAEVLDFDMALWDNPAEAKNLKLEPKTDEVKPKPTQEQTETKLEPKLNQPKPKPKSNKIKKATPKPSAKRQAVLDAFHDFDPIKLEEQFYKNMKTKPAPKGRNILTVTADGVVIGNWRENLERMQANA